MATGHFRSGILLTPITARLIREWIMDKTSALDWIASVLCAFRRKKQKRRKKCRPEATSKPSLLGGPPRLDHPRRVPQICELNLAGVET